MTCDVAWLLTQAMLEMNRQMKPIFIKPEDAYSGYLVYNLKYNPLGMSHSKFIIKTSVLFLHRDNWYWYQGAMILRNVLLWFKTSFPSVQISPKSFKLQSTYNFFCLWSRNNEIDLTFTLVSKKDVEPVSISGELQVLKFGEYDCGRLNRTLFYHMYNVSK